MNDGPSYLKEMLTSQTNVYAGLGSCAAGVLLSLPFGLGLGLLPVLAYAAGAAIASLYVPSSPGFRSRVDARYRRERREAARVELCSQIDKRVPGIDWKDGKVGGDDDTSTRYRQKGGKHLPYVSSEAATCLAAYRRMCERVNSLQEVANDRRTQMSTDDIERLQETTLDYLSLWLASLVTDDRARAVDQNEVRQRIDALDDQIASAGDTPEARQLRRAKADYSALLARQSAMQTKRQAIDAAMMAMPDQIDEIYQMIMAAPYSSSISSKLDESLSKLRLQEELEQELDDDLRDTVPSLHDRPLLRAVPSPALDAARKQAASAAVKR